MKEKIVWFDSKKEADVYGKMLQVETGKTFIVFGFYSVVGEVMKYMPVEKEWFERNMKEEGYEKIKDGAKSFKWRKTNGPRKPNKK